jgi:superfamily II DNA or RNA helicase
MQSSMIDSMAIEWPENPTHGSVTFRPYQRQSVDTVIKNYTSGASKRQLIVLATGLGKGICMGGIVDWSLKVLKKPVMILAHREELLEQVAFEVGLVIGPDYLIEIEQADRRASLQAHIVMASVATLGREGSKRIERFPRDHFGVICIDEAHHSCAVSYRNVIERFKPEDYNTKLCGLTATPRRGDKESISDIFDTMAYNLDIVRGTREKYLCPIVSWRVSSQTDLSRVRTTAGDFNLKDLSAAVNNQARNTLIVETWQKRFPDKQALVFATDLDHVQRLTEEFQSIGVSAVGVTGDMPKEERRAAVEGFKNGSIKIALNFGIFLEGFNHPRLELIIQARPTQSQLLITQVSGRLTRLFEGKTVGHIIEIIDEHSSKTATVAKIFNFRQEFDCEGHDFLECSTVADQMISEKEEFNPYNCVSWSEMKIRFERSTKQNPQGFKVRTIEERSPGEREAKEDIFSEFNENNDYFDSRYRYFKSNTLFKFIHSDRDSSMRYQVIAYPNGLGGYDCALMKKPLDAPRSSSAEKEIAYRGASAPDAIRKMEDYILDYHQDWDRLLWIHAPWKKKAQTECCSDKQYALILKNGLSRLPQNQISKMDASNLISGFFSRNG